MQFVYGEIIIQWVGLTCHYAGLFTIANMRLGIGLLFVIRNIGVSAIQGVLKCIEVYGVTVGTFRTVRYTVGVRC